MYKNPLVVAGLVIPVLAGASLPPVGRGHPARPSPPNSGSPWSTPTAPFFLQSGPVVLLELPSVSYGFLLFVTRLPKIQRLKS